MKRIFTFIFALAFALLAEAQQKNNVNGSHQRKVTPRQSTDDENRMALEKGAANLTMHTLNERGNAFFMEDFSLGFDGNNAFGAWSHEDSGNNTIWMMADADSPAGAYSTTADQLVSTTADNGWVIFDCDLYQDGEISSTNPAIDVTGYLTSPVINLTSATSTILEFQQYFRYCCYDSKPIFVEVTNDGGLNWYVFDGAPEFSGGANDQSDNPYVTAIDVSGVAAGQSAVQFRFGWQPNGNSTHSHYYWGIDDVAIYENNVTDDVVVSYVTTGDIATDFEYRVIPLEQSIPEADGGMNIGTIYSNIGTNAHASSIKVEILDASMAMLDADSVDVSILPNSLLPNPVDPFDTLYIPTGWQPTVVGTYYARTTVRFPETDATPNDNTMMKKFFVTTDEYGHDDPDMLDGEMTPIAGTGTAADPFPPTGYGSYLTVYSAGSTAYGVTVRLDNGTDTGTPITVLLMKRAEDYNLTDAEFVAGAEYDILNPWTPNGSASFPWYFPFENSADLDAGNFYFAGIQTIDEGTKELSVQATVEQDADYSTGTWAETVDGDFIWFFGLGSLTDFTPAVRLILSERENLGISESTFGLNSFQINPNPAVNTATLNFALQGPHYIAYEVRDVTGKLMDWKNIGQFTGNNNHTIDVTGLAAGNYMVNLIIDGEHLVTQQMSVIK